MKLVSVSITGPDADWFAQHARYLVDHRLAVPAATSFPPSDLSRVGRGGEGASSVS